MFDWKSVAHINNSILVEGPNSNFVAYNPYTRQVARFKTDNLDLTVVENELTNAGFSTERLDIPRRPSITFSVSDKCNLNCIYCFTGDKTGNIASISSASEALIEFFNTPDVPENPTVAFFGSGEPFENFEFIRSLVLLAEKEGLKKGIKPRFLATTNGVFEESKLDFVLDKDIYLSISVDGPPEIQDAQRPLLNGGGSSNIVLKNVMRLVAEKRDFHIRTTITSNSVNKMAAMVDYWADNGVRKVYLEPVALTGACEEDPELRPDPKGFALNFVKALKLARKRKISINTEAVRKLRTGTDKYFCPAIAGDNYLYTTDGRRSFCYEDLAPAGDSAFIPVNQLRPYEVSIVSSPIDSVTWPPTKCSGCHVASACGSTCPKRAYDTNGDFDDPYAWQCATNKLLIPEAISIIADESI